MFCINFFRLNSRIGWLVFLMLYAGLSISLGNDLIFNGRQRILNFGPLQYNAHMQNWGIVQDSKDVIYVANNYGLLQYDGNEWVLFPAPENMTLRSLGISAKDDIYFGGSGGLGYLVPDESGFLNFFDLKHLMPDNVDNNFIIKQTHVLENQIVFVDGNYLFIYKDNSITYIYTDTRFLRSYKINQTLYVQDATKGIFAFNENTGVLEPLPSLDILKSNFVYSMLPWSENEYLLGVDGHGLLIYSPLENDLDKTLRPFDNQANDYLIQNAIYDATYINDDAFAIATFKGGVVILNKDGDWIDSITTESGLQDNSVWAVFADNNSNLWMGLNNGISMKSTHNPMHYWNEENGIPTNVHDLIWYDNKIYASTNQGVFVLKKDVFEQLPGLDQAAYKFGIREGSKAQLFVGARSGMFEISGDKAVPVYSGGFVFVPYFSERLPNYVLMGAGNGIIVYEKRNQKWEFHGRIKGVRGDCRSFLLDKEGILWVEQYRQGILKVEMDFENVLNPTKVEMLQADSWDIGMANLFPYNDSFMLATQEGIFIYDAENKEVVPLPLAFDAKEISGKTIFPIHQMQDGTIWFFLRPLQSFINELFILQADKEGLYHKTILPCNCFPKMPVHAMIDTPHRIWIGGAEGVFMYDKQAEQRNNDHFNVRIGRVETTEERFFHHVLDEEFFIGLPFGRNEVRFHFASNEFGEGRKGIRYSYRLYPWEKEFSDWTSLMEKAYANLRPGSYEFQVKAKDISGKEVASEIVQIIVKRPWFLERWMYAVYILLIAFIVFGINRWYTFSLRRKNELLQRLVAEHNSEITKQNLEIKEKNEELHQQKEEILAQSVELEKINRNLETRIIDELSKNRKKDMMLIQQSRQAAMGEMIGNIAHQWRQPLNAVGVIIQNIQEAHEFKELTDEYLNQKVNQSMEIIQYMSQTIDDFRNFFKPDKNAYDFNVKMAVEKSISFVQATLKNHGIHISFEAPDDIIVNGYPNEYAQVVLNLLNNAKDVLIERKTENPIIEVILFKKEGKSYLSVSDNAGGIPPEIKEKIFTPYFSTKEPGKGTGLGLYMSKTIVEKNMGGSLSFENTDTGVEFLVVI